MIVVRPFYSDSPPDISELIPNESTSVFPPRRRKAFVVEITSLHLFPHLPSLLSFSIEPVSPNQSQLIGVSSTIQSKLLEQPARSASIDKILSYSQEGLKRGEDERERR